MMQVSKLGWQAYGLAALVVVLDQASKYWILSILKLPDLPTLKVAGPFYLTMVWNQGVSFGLFRAQHDVVRWALVVFSLVVAAVLAGWARKADRPFGAVGLGLVIGGAIGNAIDRVFYGAVADFFSFHAFGLQWYVFNIADMAIVAGVAGLLYDSLFGGHKKAGNPPNM